MKVNASKTGLMPMTIKVRPEVREKLKTIAKANGLSLQYIVNLSATFGADMVEAKLKELHLRPAA